MIDFDLSQFNKEILAGYITPDFVVYSFAPNYIQEMAKDFNTGYRKYYQDNFFKFEKSEDIFGDEPPAKIVQLRKELEKEYKK